MTPKNLGFEFCLKIYANRILVMLLGIETVILLESQVHVAIIFLKLLAVVL